MRWVTDAGRPVPSFPLNAGQVCAVSVESCRGARQTCWPILSCRPVGANEFSVPARASMTDCHFRRRRSHVRPWMTSHAHTLCLCAARRRRQYVCSPIPGIWRTWPTVWPEANAADCRNRLDGLDRAVESPRHPRASFLMPALFHRETLILLGPDSGEHTQPRVFSVSRPDFGGLEVGRAVCFEEGCARAPGTYCSNSWDVLDSVPRAAKVVNSRIASGGPGVTLFKTWSAGVVSPGATEATGHATAPFV